jgi:hypothetical protein
VFWSIEIKPKNQMKNYTTKIPAKQTVGEITELLTEHYAENIMIINNDRKPKAIKFILIVVDKEVGFLLEANVDATYRAMVADKKVTKAHKNKEQAERTAWRTLKEYLHIKLDYISIEQNKEARMLKMQEEFFGSMITPNNKTVFELFKENQQLLLT